MGNSIAILLLGVLACVHRDPSQGNTQNSKQDKSVTEQEKCEWLLEIHAPRSEVLLGEPYALTVSLKNVSSVRYEVSELLSPEYGFLQVWLTTPAKAEVPYMPFARRDARGQLPRSLSPGESIADAVYIYGDRDGWRLKQPGAYSVRASFDNGKIKATSKPVVFVVKMPEGNDDQQAAELIMQKEATLLLLLEGGKHLEKGEELLKTVIEKYPNSNIAPYAELALGLSMTQAGFNVTTKQFEEPTYDHAIKRLERALPRVKDPVIATRATSKLISLLRKVGRTDDVPKIMAIYNSNHKNARTIPGVGKLLETESTSLKK